LVFRYGIYGKGSPPTALGAEAWHFVPKLSPTYPNTDTAQTVVYASEIDGRPQPVNMQLVFTRRAADQGDTDANNLYLIKIVMRYQAYL
jgi:hypothetical protein